MNEIVIQDELQKNNSFDFNKFIELIDLKYLATGLNETFIKEINNIVCIYPFNETQMAGLYNEAINKNGLFDYRLLKKKANILYNYLYHTHKPKFLINDEEELYYFDLVEYLENLPAFELLNNLMPDYPEKYLATINDIYSNIDLPKGVLNCMIMFVLKQKNGILPTLSYFEKVSESWIKNNIFTTMDAIRYTTKTEKKNKNRIESFHNNSQNDNTQFHKINFEHFQNVIQRDVFVAMGNNACLLYFYLFFHSENGKCNCPKSMMRLIDATIDDYQMLINNNFIEEIEDGNVKILDYPNLIK